MAFRFVLRSHCGEREQSSSNRGEPGRITGHIRTVAAKLGEVAGNY
jgi:hypothetical protein